MEIEEIIDRYKDTFIHYIDKIDKEEIKIASKEIDTTLKNGNSIFIMGNGGSLATSLHIAEDLMLNNDYKSKVITLDNPSCMSAVANDFSYEDLYVKQLENLFEKGDLIITLSASGLSPNVVKAIEYVKGIGKSISISGFHGGQTKRKADYHIFVRTEVGDYEATEDLHLMIGHLLVKIIKELSYG